MTAPSSPLEPRRALVLAAGLALASAACSGLALGNDLAWDDLDWLSVEGRGCGAELIECFRHVQLKAYYRPVVALSFSVPELLRGGQAGAAVQHADNLVLRALLAFVGALALLRMVRPAPAGIAAAALFALHPVLSPATAWVGGRTDLLASLGACGFVWALWEAGERARPVVLASAIVAFAFALLAKEQTSLLLALVPLVWRAKGRAWGDVAFVTGALGVMVVGFWAVLRAMVPTHTFGFALHWSLADRLGAVMRTGGVFSVTALLPSGSALHQFALPVMEPPAFMGIVLFVLVLGAAAAAWWRAPELRLPVAWSALTLAPVLNFFPAGSHLTAPYRYVLTLFGVAWLLGVAWARWHAQRRAPARVVLSVALVYWALMNGYDAGEWETDEVASVAAVDANPEDLYHRMFVVTGLQRRAEYDAALTVLDEGLGLLFGTEKLAIGSLDEAAVHALERRAVYVYRVSEARDFQRVLASMLALKSDLSVARGDLPAARDAMRASVMLWPQDAWRARLEQLSK